MVQNFITHGKTGDIIVVIARTGDLLDLHGMTAFAVERGTPDLVEVKRKIN